MRRSHNLPPVKGNASKHLKDWIENAIFLSQLHSKQSNSYEIMYTKCFSLTQRKQKFGLSLQEACCKRLYKATHTRAYQGGGSPIIAIGQYDLYKAIAVSFGDYSHNVWCCPYSRRKWLCSYSLFGSRLKGEASALTFKYEAFCMQEGERDRCPILLAGSPLQGREEL